MKSEKSLDKRTCVYIICIQADPEYTDNLLLPYLVWEYRCTNKIILFSIKAIYISSTLTMLLSNIVPEIEMWMQTP